MHTVRDRKDQSVGLWPNFLYLGIPLLFDEADQSVRGGIVGRHGRAALKLGLDFLGQLLPQLHPAREGWERKMSPVPEPTRRHNRPSLSDSPPLVEAVDIPDDALDEDLVLVHGCRERCPSAPCRSLSYPAASTPPGPTLPPLTDQGSQNERCELGEHD